METWGNGGSSLDHSMEQSEEFQLLQAYCNRRKQQLPTGLHQQGPASFSKNQDHAESSGKSMGKPALKKRRVLQSSGDSGSLIPSRGATEHVQNAQIHEDNVLLVDVGLEEGGSLPFRKVTEHLVQIADSTELQDDDDLESDCVEEEVIQQLVELLKKSGDELDEKIKKDKALQQKIQKSLNYSIFEKVTSSILDRLVAPTSGRAAAAVPYKQQIAWACEVTHRLSAMDCIPKRTVLVYGTQYIQQHLSPWVQHQGGWDSAFEDVD